VTHAAQPRGWNFRSGLPLGSLDSMLAGGGIS
jgi:hypothetical protein